MWHRLILITGVLIGLAAVRSTSAFSKSPRIVIMGGGVAGLSAAEQLHKRGLKNFVVLEAMDRIGGRIETSAYGLPGTEWVEMGAQWIYGDRKTVPKSDKSAFGSGEHLNPIYDYAAKHNLIHPDREMASENFSAAEYRTESGRVLNEALAANLTRFLYDRLLNLTEVPADAVDTNPQMDMYLKSEATLMLRRGPPLLRKDEFVRDTVVRWFERVACVRKSCDQLKDMDVRSQLLYSEGLYEGSQRINLRGGFASVVDVIASRVPNRTIVLKAPVKSIEVVQMATGKTKKTKPVVVVALNGSRIEADHVIVTASLGVLQAGIQRNMFVPALSEDKLSALTRMGYGTVNKVFLEFDRPFWPKGTVGYHMLWTSADGQPVLGNDAWTRWANTITGFYTVPFASNVLVGWLTGEAARYMEHLSDWQVQDACVRSLEKFVGGATVLPRVKTVKRSRWWTNEYTRGSNSFVFSTPAGAEDPNAVLAEPIYITHQGTKKYPAVMFAGEATHSTQYATVHGARESGIREANRIASIYHTSGSSGRGRDRFLVVFVMCMAFVAALARASFTA